MTAYEGVRGKINSPLSHRGFGSAVGPENLTRRVDSDKRNKAVTFFFILF